MTLDAHVITAPDGVRGFDTNVPITAAAASAFYDHGYRFAVRYVARVKPKPNDISTPEAQRLLEAGLGLMLVQHVESEDGWSPSAQKGDDYGSAAASIAADVGIAPGVNVWLDLEGVAVGTAASGVIEYCNRWHAAVAAAGFLPGLYVGWHSGLTPVQLYKELRFTHYWGAYNLNADQAPARRGLQMKQAERTATDKVRGVKFLFQTDRVHTDALGGRPVVFAPENWLE